MLLAFIVSVATLVVLVVAGLAGFLVERSANRHEP